MGKGAELVTTHIFLIRHPESEWNRRARYAGQRDISLSPLGLQQGQELARRFEGEPLDAIYSSPLQRARKVAEAIAQRQELPVELDDSFLEICHGLWEGLTVGEVAASFPTEYAQWHAEPHRVVMPRGESLAEVRQRAATAFRRIVAKHPDGTVAITTHDAVLRVLLLDSLGLPLEHFWKWRFANASLSELVTNGQHNSFQLALLNDTSHLRGLQSDCDRQAL